MAIISFIIVFLGYACVSCESACPTGCVCEADAVTCSQLEKFPQPFVSTAKTVLISMSHLPTIPPRAFKDVPNAEQIHLKQVQIGTIQGCAFEAMSTTADVLIDLTAIDKIEGNAFPNIHVTGHNKEFSISASTINTISSFAFDRIQGFHTFQIHGTDISTIHNYAFHRFNNIENFNMFDVNITTMQSNAMEGFMDIHIMDIYFARFSHLQCDTLDRLRVDLNRNFSFHSLEVICDCGLAWLHDASRDSSGLRLDDVICFAPVNFKNKHLKNLTHENLCNGQPTPSCETPNPARPEVCAHTDTNPAGLMFSNQNFLIVSIVSMLLLIRQYTMY